MSDTVLVWMEASLNVAYLVVVWALMVAMVRRCTSVSAEDRRVATLILGAFLLLAIGDTGHVVFRVLAHVSGRMAVQSGLVGLGALATAITVTLFYVLMLMAWRGRFDKRYGRFEWLLFSCVPARFVLMALPANDWPSTVPPQPWSTFRNLPLLLLGVGCAYPILRDSRACGDRTFWWMGAMILISYACYLPVILCVQQVPLVGMLMIPKTMAYVVVGVLAFREMYHPPLLTATPEGEAL